MSTSRLAASCNGTQFLQHAPPIRIFVIFSPAPSLVKSHAKTARPHIADRHLDPCTNAFRSMSAILDLHLISHVLDEWQICDVKNLLFCPLYFWPKGQNSRGQKYTKSVFLTKNFGQKYLGQKCTKTAFLTKFSGQKWPKFLTTTVVSKCWVKRGQNTNSRGQKCTKSVFLTKNFGRRYLGQKCIKIAFLTKFNGQKWPKFFTTTVVSKCSVKL